MKTTSLLETLALNAHYQPEVKALIQTQSATIQKIFAEGHADELRDLLAADQMANIYYSFMPKPKLAHFTTCFVANS